MTALAMADSTANAPVPFAFESHQIRTVVNGDGNPWFVARDVCAAMDISWQGMKSLNAIPDTWKRVGKLPTRTRDGRNQINDVATINEPAVYKLAFRSNKPEADRFTNWIASEVIPALRQTGKYEVCPTTGTLTPSYLALPRDNPFQAVDRFAADKHPRYVPSEEDFWKAYDAASEDDQSFLLTALHTAARRGELFRLTWPDVDFKVGTIRLGTRKTATGGMEYATLPMTSKLAAALSALRSRGPRSMFVFCQEDGEPYSYRIHYMERLCKRAGVRKFGFHAIRHLSASILAREKVDIPTIQAVLRHKSPTTTARYLHSLGVVENVLEGVFGDKQKAPGKITPEGL